MKKLTILLSLFLLASAMTLSAQSKTSDRESAQETVAMTHYYDLKVDLNVLNANRDVVTVRLPDDSGLEVFYSFDTEAEALSAMEEKVDATRAALYCICYRDTYYNGPAIIFYGYDVNSLGDLGWNDKISSYYCSPGAYMTLYEHKNFGGASLPNVSGSNGNIHTIGWGDKASSITFSF